MRSIIVAGLVTFLLVPVASAQVSQNVTLFAQIDPVPIRNSGSWGYTTASGEEYALLGTNTGTSIIAIDDADQIQEVAFIPGPTSNWREITAIGDHAFVTSEGSGALAGMQVIDLSGLPATATLVTTYTDTFTRAHIIQRDIYSEDPVVYVMGPQPGVGGMHILDVSTPATPVEIGVWDPYYVHDAHIRGDRAYVAAINDDFLEVVDISDRTNPTLVTRVTYPSANTHSSFTTADGTHLMVADETDGTVARMWNIEDESNIFQVAEYSANLASLVHNPYNVGDLMFISHNTEGLRVLDVADPAVIVEVGFYDTWSGASGGFHGLWSVYPWFPSGKILGGNREDGLYVWEFNGTRAGRIYGTVTDAQSAAPISAATVEIVDTARQALTGGDGTYALGELPSDPAGYTIEVSAVGYVTESIIIVLAGGDSLTVDFDLEPASTAVAGAGSGAVTRTYIAQNVPNPFNPTTTIRFELDAAGPARVYVFDVAGRSVVTLADGPHAAGVHTLRWDGRDVSGRRVPSGTYMYVLEAAGERIERKMLMVK